MQNDNENQIQKLTDDLLILILKNFTPSELKKIKLVSKFFKSTIESDKMWKIRLMLDFGIKPEKAYLIANPHQVYESISIFSERIYRYCYLNYRKQFQSTFSDENFLGFFLDPLKNAQLVDTRTIFTNNDQYCLAAIIGNKNLMQHLLLKLETKPNAQAFHWTAISGNFELAQMLFPLGFKVDKEFINFAMYSGNYNFVQFLFKEYPQFRPEKDELDNAVVSGNVKVVNELIVNYKLIPDQDNMSLAGLSGNPEMVALMIKHKLAVDNDLLTQAVRSGKIELVKTLTQEPYNLKPNDADVREALTMGNVKMSKFLHQEYQLSPTKENFENAALLSGCLEILKMMCEDFNLTPESEILKNTWIRDDQKIKDYLKTQLNTNADLQQTELDSQSVYQV